MKQSTKASVTMLVLAAGCFIAVEYVEGRPWKIAAAIWGMMLFISAIVISSKGTPKPLLKV